MDLVPGALMVKFDVDCAYCNVPIHPENRHPLAQRLVRWSLATRFAHCLATVQELFPIFVAAHVWGRHWERSKVEFFSDNQGVVAILNTSSTRDRSLMHFIRRLTMAACRFHQSSIWF